MNIKMNIKLLLVGILALSQATDCSQGATLQEKEVEHAAAVIPLDLDLFARIKAMDHPKVRKMMRTIVKLLDGSY